MQRQGFVIYLSRQGDFVYNRGKAAKWDALRAEENSGLGKERPLCRITLRIKERQTFCAAPARDCGKSYSARTGSLSCMRTVSCWNFWGWTQRRRRRSATGHGTKESRIEGCHCLQFRVFMCVYAIHAPLSVPGFTGTAGDIIHLHFR